MDAASGMLHKLRGLVSGFWQYGKGDMAVGEMLHRNSLFCVGKWEDFLRGLCPVSVGAQKC